MSIVGYFKFVGQISMRLDPSMLRICSIFPPTRSDAAWAQGYANAHVNALEADGEEAALRESIRNLEVPDIATRIELHAFYNGELKRGARIRGITFVDDFSSMQGKGGLIAERFMVGHNGDDHHMNFASIENEIEQLLLRYT